jgi:hypothetical protein
MSNTPEPLIEDILQRARAEQQLFERQKDEAERCRREVDRLHAAFTRVKNFTAHHLGDKLGRPATDEEFAEAYATHLLALGRELTNQRELLSRGPGEIASGNDDGKAFALTILRQAVRQDAVAVMHSLGELMRAPSRLQSAVSYWLRVGLEQEIMGDQTLAEQRPEGICQAIGHDEGTDEEAGRNAGGQVEETRSLVAALPEEPSGSGAIVALVPPATPPERRAEQISTDDDPDRWLTVTQAARIAAANPGVLSRAADSGALRTNGLRGTERRIWAIDLCRWINARALRPEPSESEEHVEQLVRRHTHD